VAVFIIHKISYLTT